MRRNLLMFQPAGSAVDLTACARAGNWQVNAVPDLRSLSVALAESTMEVGLLVLDKPEIINREALGRLVSRTSLEWISILPKGLIEEPYWTRFLVENCCDYHTLPVDAERLSVTIGHALGRAALKQSLSSVGEWSGRYQMVGQSRTMRELYAKLDRVVKAEAPVLISGESGTGKELVARAIHRHSPRASGPFIPVNCGALPPNLIQSELFGHERGAFTGAHQRKIGSLEAANGGVVFLDEIGDLPLELQTHMLRFLEERTIVRLGSTQRTSIDVRVVAATHVDLNQAVRHGKFREDLFYRLNVLQLNVPPLRERLDDIDLFTSYLFEQLSSQKSPLVQGFSRDALEAMRSYTWPGNVRELINRVQRALIMGEHRLVTPGDLGLPTHDDLSNVVNLSSARAAAEKDMIQLTLRAHDNNVSRAARELGVSRVTLYRLMDKLAIGPRSNGDASSA
jgi:DNA-binding NtrC family response regulator